MTNIKILILFLIKFILSVYSNEIITELNNKKLIIKTDLINFEEAKKFCDKNKMELLSILSENDQNDIVNLMKTYDIALLWINAFEDKELNVFRWGKTNKKIDGYTNWGANRPFFGTHENKSIYLFSGIGYRWLDILSTAEASVMCIESTDHLNNVEVLEEKIKVENDQENFDENKINNFYGPNTITFNLYSTCE